MKRTLTRATARRLRTVRSVAFEALESRALFSGDVTGTISAEPVTAAAAADGMTIPTTHARLWLTPERLTRARQWYATNGFNPGADDPLGSAFRYQLTGETQYARAAVDRLMAFTIPPNELAGTQSNTYRWDDWVPVVFDWAYDQMTPQERSTFIDRYNGYVQTMSQKSWGGPTMPANNYFWGYLRNEMNWAVATWHENPMAAGFLEHALSTRWQDAFVPWATSDGLGGVAAEGSQYGRYMLEYPIMPFTSAGLMGRDVYRETDFFRDAVYGLIYATSTGPVYNEDGTDSFYQVFPFSDDQFSEGYPSTDYENHYGDFMTAMATGYDGSPLEGYARQWLALTGTPATRHIAAVDDGGAATPFTSLPLDYYAPGMQYLYTKDSWGPDATNINFQFGHATTVGGHLHHDWGSFQILSGGRWLTKETTGYASNIVGYGGTGTSPVGSTVAHNGILMGGMGLGSADLHDGPPRVTRLDTQGDYVFASVDLSDAYRAHASWRPERDDNPNVANVVRDFVYIRSMGVLVALDRLESTSEVTAAANVTKTFLLHFPNTPTIQGPNNVMGVNGDQALRLTSLVPSGQSSPSFRVVDERPATGAMNNTDYQYRLEVDTSGQAQSYFINVLQARDLNGADVAVSMTEDATSFTITITHPTLGTAVVRLEKGMKSSGGSFGYSPAGGPPTMRALTDTVKQVSVTDAGPAWVAGTPTLSLALNNYSVNEAGGTATVTVTRNGDSSVPVTVTYGTSHGTAGEADYTAATGTLSFAAGETSKTFTVTVLNDADGEPTETINLTLSAASAGAALGARAVATLSVFDDELVVQPGPGPGGRTHVGTFGLTSGARRPTRLAFADGDGTAVVATLVGGGRGDAYRLTDGSVAFELTGTGPRSSLTLKAVGGADGRILLADSRSSGPVRAVKADRAELRGTLWIAGAAGSVTLGSISGGTVAAAGPIAGLSLRGTMTGGRVLAGVNLGADGVLGGGNDQGVGGGIRKVNILGGVSGSVFSAGVLPGANGTYGDADDVLTGGAASAILSVVTRGPVDAATRFEAGRFARARLGTERVVPMSDPRFLLLS